MEKESVMFASRSMKVRGTYIEVHPFSWGSTVKSAPLLTAIIKAGVSNIKYINDLLYNLNHRNYEVFTHMLAVVLSDIMEKAGDELVELLRLSINKSPEWIRQLSLQEFCDLVVEVYKVNESFFWQLFTKENKAVEADSITAEQAATLLMEYGHRYDDVLDKYTPAQIIMFLRHIIARELYKKADNAEAVMLAIGGSFASEPDKVTNLLEKMKEGVNDAK